MEYNGLIYSKVGDTYGVGDSSKSDQYGNGIVGGVNAAGEVVIPKRVKGTLVTAILTWSFRECTKLLQSK